MGRAKLIAVRQVKASTIVEVIVAMVVIVIVFGIAMMIFTNVTRTSLSVKKMRAAATLTQVMAEQETIRELTNQVFLKEDMHIEMKVQPYHDQNGLLQVSLTAYDANGQEIGKLNKIIIRQ